MSLKIRRSYGLWESPITPARLAGGLSLTNPCWDQSGTLLWLEGRPDRGVIVVQPPNRQAVRDLNSTISVRARVGYGGGDFTAGNGQAYFVEAASGRLWRQPLQPAPPQAVTPAFGQAASPALSPDGRWLIYVHSYEDQDCLAIVDAEGRSWPQKLGSGDDFYMQPTWHPHGKRIAWVCWNNPNMPWDGSWLQTAELQFDQAGHAQMGEVRSIAGGAEVAVSQPEFSPDGRTLAFVSDESGWWQVYLYDLVSGERRPLTQTPAEHALPAWVQGMHTYGFSPDGKFIYVLRSRFGVTSLWQVEVTSNQQRRLALDEAYTSLDEIRISPDGQAAALLASGPATSRQVITVALGGEPGANSPVQVWKRGTSEDLPASVYSRPQSVEWQGLDGDTVYGMLFPPQNEHFEGVGLPPLVVSIHSGPTRQVTSAFDLNAQFYTSRGYAFLAVNYRGSSGYGRSYRQALRGFWGIYDVQDAVSGARALADRGVVDEYRRVILGSSAGGFTVLKALQDYPGFFKAGICLYGVADHFSMSFDTHKFELHYNDGLLGPLPQAAAVYRERSPIYHLDRIVDPLALFHGEDDRVVPRRQSDEVASALRRRGVPHIYHVYSGEGHGFRKPETLEHFYHTVETFLRDFVIFS